VPASFIFNRLRTLLRKHRGWHTPARSSRITPDESHVTSVVRRNAKTASCKFFACYSYANTGGGCTTPPKFFSPLATSPKSFRMRSYEKCVRKSFKIRSYKNPRGVGGVQCSAPYHITSLDRYVLYFICGRKERRASAEAEHTALRGSWLAMLCGFAEDHCYWQELVRGAPAHLPCARRVPQNCVRDFSAPSWSEGPRVIPVLLSWDGAFASCRARANFAKAHLPDSVALARSALVFALHQHGMLFQSGTTPGPSKGRPRPSPRKTGRGSVPGRHYIHLRKGGNSGP
jgi:hypothetical protein